MDNYVNRRYNPTRRFQNNIQKLKSRFELGTICLHSLGVDSTNKSALTRCTFTLKVYIKVTGGVMVPTEISS